MGTVIFIISFLLLIIFLIMLVVGLITPNLLNKNIKEGKNKYTRKKALLHFGIGALFFLGLAIAFVPDSDKAENIQEQIFVQGVAYEIVKTEDNSMKALTRVLSSYTTQEIEALPTNKRMRYRIVVSPDIKEAQVRPTVEKIIADITSKDKDIDEISLLLYSDKALADSVYDVAMVVWAPKGELGNVTPEIARTNNRDTYDISIQVKSNLEEYLKQRNTSEEKPGMTEDQRKEIYKVIVVAQDRAQAEADKKYPINASDPNFKKENVIKNVDLYRELVEKYEAEVRKKYGITQDIQTKIIVEGAILNWPLE